jgi:hypothetical protein
VAQLSRELRLWANGANTSEKISRLSPFRAIRVQKFPALRKPDLQEDWGLKD